MLPFEHVRCPARRFASWCAILLVTSLPSTRASTGESPSTAPTTAGSAVGATDLDVAENFSVTENAAAGTVVGRPSHEHGIHFAIVAGNDDGAFAIDHRTGTLTVRRPDALDRESRPEIALTIDVTTSWPANDETSWRYLVRLLERKRDLAAVLEHRRVPVTITVNDVNEPPVVESARIDVASDVDGDVVGRLHLYDAEDGSPIAVRVLHDAPFTVDTRGVVRWLPGHRLRSPEEQMYTVTVEAVDSSDATGQGVCEIVVHPTLRDLAAPMLALRHADTVGNWAAQHGLDRLAVPWLAPRTRTAPTRTISDANAVTENSLPSSRSAGSTSADPSPPEHAGWNWLLMGFGGCSIGFLFTSLLGRGHLRRIERANRERQSVLTSESERCRSETKAATHARDEALEACRRAEEDREQIELERLELAGQLAELGAELTRSRENAALACGSPTVNTESVRTLFPLVPCDDSDSEIDLASDDCPNPVDDFLFDLAESEPNETPSPNVISTTESALDDDVDYLDFTASTEPIGTAHALCHTDDQEDVVHTELLHTPGEPMLDTSDTVKLIEPTTMSERARPSEADSPAAVELRKYLAAQFELDAAPAPKGDDVASASVAAHAQRSAATRAYDTLSGLADRLDALAEPSPAPEESATRTSVEPRNDTGDDDVLDFVQEELAEMQQMVAGKPSDAASSARTAAVAKSTDDADDKYSSVEAYMSRLLGKSKQAEPRQDPMTERQAERLAAITATDGAVNRERRARRRTTESGTTVEGEAGSPDAPVHSVDREGEREQMQSMRSVANTHANHALDSSRRRFRVRRNKMLLTLVGLIAIVVAAGCYLLS